MSSSSRKVTQADIARLAGVSQATVSLVIAEAHSGRSRVGADTKARVLDAVRRTGYAIDPIASRLAGGQSRIIGVFTYEPVFPTDGGDFFHPFLVGVEHAAMELGVDLLLYTSSPASGGHQRLLTEGSNRLGVADGVILLGRHADENDLSELIRKNFPFAYVGRKECSAGPVPYVGADYEAAAHDLVTHLLSLGHTRVGLIGSMGRREATVDRIAGYRRAMVEAGLRPILLEGVDLPGHEALDLVRQNGLTAVVTDSNAIAEGLYDAAAAEGLSVPADLSVALLGDAERPSSRDIDWTGFRIPREEMGASALRLLAQVIAGARRVEQQLLSCSLIEGSTSAAPRAL